MKIIRDFFVISILFHSFDTFNITKKFTEAL